ncbi:hypothetical protein F5876DRAFT_74746 [Lentinula aff. lateritia]|uniref:Uncharacterized protein n=1 Tax=Lentinula aff. lateritia TaxID=2804960 RepID=A0ACC1U6V6_9AGAR|nr:hypothetical protein F5876DRAFT_74746 [Lentinula aff. lateritia]
MSLFYAISLISLFWVIVHVVHRLRKPQAALLPTLNNIPRGRSWADSSTSVIVNKVLLRIQTTAFNAKHDELAGKLKDRRSRSLRKWTAAFYSIGVGAGICGLVIGLGGLLWLTGNSLFLQVLSDSAIPPSHQKRDLNSPSQHDTRSFIQPIIPGVTVPWAHLPIILIAVCLCQIVHELGHAIAGALYSVPITSLGMSLTLVLPSAFVSFPSGFLSSLDVISRARIIAAGPWHNLVLWVFLAVLGRTADRVERATDVGNILVSLGWEDMSNVGRVVVGLDDDSPLNSVLKVGSVITALDDTSLADEEDRWSQYLIPQIPSDIPWYATQPVPPTVAAKHIPPWITSASTRSDTRGNDCDDNAVCAQPDSSASILRLSVQGQDLILWNGPRKEIWEQVSVGRYAPRFWFIPTNTIGIMRDFWSYLQMATLSLFVFNLLPLPFLDGAQLLNALLDYVRPVSELGVDEESGISQRGPAALWKRRFERLVQFGTLGMILLYMLLHVGGTSA